MYKPPAVLKDDYYKSHAQLLCNTYRKITGKQLLEVEGLRGSNILDLYQAPFAIVSHGVEADPVFNFGNQVALELFDLEWPEFIVLPSRKSAEPMQRAEREMLLKEVSQNGYIDNYSGVRIASTGKRFLIKQALVWNLVNEQGRFCGQAAMFKHWTYL